MKKFFTILLMLFAVISIAMAQPATMTKGQVDNSTQVDNTLANQVCADNRLNVEIISDYGEHFHHPQHPETGQTCPFSVWFITSQQYEWYQWETTLPNWEMWNDYTFHSDVYSSGYIKVTVGDNYGNIGTDSIWFNIKDQVSPLDNFIMEIGDDLYPTFSGIATTEHYKLQISREYIPGNTGWSKYIFLSPGEWSYKEYNAHYHQDTTWLFRFRIYDTCQMFERVNIPGLLINAEQNNDNWYLSTKTILQKDFDFYQINDNLTCIYFVYSIDQYGQRHYYMDENGNPVILPPETTLWRIPGPHIDPYYQCGVAKVLDDGTYELLSLSNKIPNPLLDVTGTSEQNKKDNFSIYPNPNSGYFTVNGTGTLNVFNILGQKIITEQVQGQTSLNLPRGLYILRFTSGSTNSTKKVVVN